MDEEGALISIGEFARRVGVSIDTLRRWDRKGILTAVRVGPRSGRKYLESDIKKIKERGRNYGSD